MSTEERILEDIFGAPMWKNKFRISWCELCDTATLIRPCCGNLCNCGGCEKCVGDSDINEFDKAKTLPSQYLTTDESQIYYKGQRIKKYIRESLEKGELEINWERALMEGQISKNDFELFYNLIIQFLGNRAEEVLKNYRQKWDIIE